VVEVSLVEDSREDYGDLARMIEDRAERGRVLYAAMRPLIVRLSADTYSVPSSGNSRRSYRVRYGRTVEDCSCPDHRHHPEVSCRHLACLGIMYGTRRLAKSGLRQLEDRYRHELLGDEERQELRDEIRETRYAG
jgi:hypothetical protein